MHSREFNIRIEADVHCMVSIAMDEVTDIREPKVLVEFGASAACDVEIKMIVCLADDVDTSASAEIFSKASRRRQAAAVCFGPFGAVISGEPADSRLHEFAGADLTESAETCFDERYEDTRLDLAPLQVADRYILFVFHPSSPVLGRYCGPLCASSAARFKRA